MRKIIIYKRCLLLALPLLLAVACKKVDDRLDSMRDGISAVAAPYTVTTGDSLTVTGRLHLEQSPVLTLAGVPVTYIEVDPENEVAYEDIPGGVSALRFKVTPDMGEGRQALEIRVGGFFQVLYVNINTRPELGNSRPDTTLIVEEIFDGNIPGFAQRYATTAGNSSKYLTYFSGRSVTANGNIYLQSSKDIYLLSGGQLQTLLQSGDALTIEGQQVNVLSFTGAAVSADESTMFLSVYTDMTGYENYTHAWLLLKTTPALNNFEIVNRTWYKEDTVYWNPGDPDAYYTQPVYFPAEVVDNGPVENTMLMAEDLYIDAQKRLLFLNSGSGYYARLELNGRISKFADFGTVSYSQDGSKALIASYPSMTLFDLEYMEPAAVVPLNYSNWNYSSFEENPGWKFTTNTGSVNMGGPNIGLLGLPNGEFLHIPNSSQQLSIGAINPATRSIYTFAGIEKGYQLVNNDDPIITIQRNFTGQAKYVNFSDHRDGGMEFIGNCTFIGMDNQNNIYFMRGGQRTNGGSRGVPMLPKIYRLYRP